MHTCMSVSVSDSGFVSVCVCVIYDKKKQILYLGCCKLSLRVEHSVTSRGAGKKWQWHLGQFKFNLGNVFWTKKLFWTLWPNIVVLRSRGGSNPDNTLEETNFKCISFGFWPILWYQSDQSFYFFIFLLDSHENAFLAHCRHPCFFAKSPRDY